MSVVSITFLACYLVLLTAYWLIPKRYKNIVLLLASYGFVATWGWYCLLFLIGATAVSWYAGRTKIFISKAISIGILLAALVVVKYTGLAISVIGISFFTFQAISYVADVYRGDIAGENDFIAFALYIAFFPQIVAGPIAKSKDQIKRYKLEKVFDLVEIERSWGLMLYGYFMKMVIADRLAIFVDSVYADITSADRVSIVLAIVFYTIQIYCDFAGYSLIAMGIGKSFGIELPENFRQPYLAVSLNDFWKRWHISLTSWFRDYVYFPLGGNRKGQLRTYVNIIIVFVLSGIWHGAGLTFFIWGLLHGVLQVIERIIDTRLQVKSNVLDFIRGIITFGIVALLWVPFRADNMNQVLELLSGVCVNANQFSREALAGHGVNLASMMVLMICICLVLVADIIQKRGKNIVAGVESMNVVLRWTLLLGVFFAIIVFGVYGPGYDAANFIYYQF